MSYQERRGRLAQSLRLQRGGEIRLGKTTSNLFRDRQGQGSPLDVSDFQHVLSVDPQTRVIETEGMVTYEALADAALTHSLMPAVVPQLKSITIGGAVGGIGIESSSFRFGLPHEMVLEMDVLLGNGDIVCCTPDNEHRDLFFGLANSYGSLGYILRLKIEGIPVKPYVRLTHLHFQDRTEFFSRIETACRGPYDFVDGVVFSAGEHYLVLGEFCDEAPYTSDYTYLKVYYRSIRERSEDYLTVRDYLWRWDTDWFWCSKNLYAQNPLMRRFLGRKRLNSITYQKLMRWNTRVGLTRRLNALTGIHRESVIQDVDIPLENAPAFIEFFEREIGIRPVWICPAQHDRSRGEYPLFPMRDDTLYINFGFWDRVRSRQTYPRGYFNRLIEEEVTKLGGIKSLYSESFYSRETFDQQFGGDHYRALKARYDPDNRLKDLYQKCVLRQ
ncbi:MAG: FAD-binding oxidoreductase [Proteobacteria bacterium]|nr:FAD-binding oxidoreductase [Pseudomonadota bacterium]